MFTVTDSRDKVQIGNSNLLHVTDSELTMQAQQQYCAADKSIEMVFCQKKTVFTCWSENSDFATGTLGFCGFYFVYLFFGFLEQNFGAAAAGL